MKRSFIILISLVLISCVTGPDQFARSINDEFSLKSYSAENLNDKKIKANTAFIFTLLTNTKELRIHQFNNETTNEVWVSEEATSSGGYAEMVVKFQRDENGEKIDGTGAHVTDCVNMGSFNYKHPESQPLGHFAQDILPWIMLGNCREDPTTTEQRISAYILDIELSLEDLASSKSSYYLPADFSFKESGQAETVSFLLSSLEKESFDLYNFVLNDQSNPDQRKKFYKALGSGINKMINDKV